MPEPRTHEYDALFQTPMRDPDLAGEFLRNHLPFKFAELLDGAPPELLSGSFVDENLAKRHSDFLFRLRLKSGRPALGYLLLERKNPPDESTTLHLLRYIVRILSKWYDSHDQLPLPIVLPIVACQGLENWTFSSAFINLFGRVPEPMRPYLVSFRHDTVDPTRSRSERIMGCLSREFETRGKARALLRVLEKRFGAVSGRLYDRLMAADVASIEVWLDRAIDAHDLNSVFDSSEIG